MNAETITSRIHDKADAELKRSIAAVVDRFGNDLRAIGVQPYLTIVPLHRNFVLGIDATLTPEQHKALPEQIAIPIDKVLERIHESAFRAAHEAHRTNAIDTYMKRVEELSSRVDELQDSVEQIRQ